ncbi:MAG: hypothetical protein WA687_13685 [Solirubrobacterales bacterium]
MKAHPAFMALSSAPREIVVYRETDSEGGCSANLPAYNERTGP